jgi:hypothetical protein
MRLIGILLVLTFLFEPAGCKDKVQENTIEDLDQVQEDGSNDYKYIFRDIINKEKEEQRKYRKSEFDPD